MKKLLLLLLLTIAVPVTVCNAFIGQLSTKPKEAAKPGYKWVQAYFGNAGPAYWKQVPEHYTLNPGIGIGHWGPPQKGILPSGFPTGLF